MNILFIKNFFVGFMVSEIPRVSVFGHCPYSFTFPYMYCIQLYTYRSNIRLVKKICIEQIIKS